MVANCYGCNQLILCTAHKDGLCVPCQQGEEVEGGEEEEVVVDPNGSALSNLLSACSRWEQPQGIFCCRGGGLGGR